MVKVYLSKDEQKAIASLKRLAKKWPDSLSLFSWSGSLCVMKRDEESDMLCPVESDIGIDSDGGCPTDQEVFQHFDVDIEYE